MNARLWPLNTGELHLAFLLSEKPRATRERITITVEQLTSELWSCMKGEVAVLVSPSLIVFMVSVYVKAVLKLNLNLNNR